MDYNSIFNGAEIDNLLALVPNKQDKLQSGTNIKTINGQDIMGGGDLVIESVTEAYVAQAIASAITQTLNTEV